MHDVVRLSHMRSSWVHIIVKFHWWATSFRLPWELDAVFSALNTWFLQGNPLEKFHKRILLYKVSRTSCVELKRYTLTSLPSSLQELWEFHALVLPDYSRLEKLAACHHCWSSRNSSFLISMVLALRTTRRNRKTKLSKATKSFFFSFASPECFGLWNDILGGRL